MFENFDLKTTAIFKKAEKERMELSHPYVGSEHLLLSILSNNDSLTKTLAKYQLTYSNFKKELISVVGTSHKNIEVNLYTPLLKKIIENAINNAKEDNEGIVTPNHLFLAILEEGEGIAIRLLVGMNIDLEEIYNELNSSSKSKHNSMLSKIGIVLNDTVDLDELVIGRDKELNFIIETLLRRQKNNPLLIGKAGVGKTAIIEQLARRIKKNEVPQELLNKKIISINVGSLVAGTKYRGEFEEKLNKIINEVTSNDDVILFIDEIHTLSNAGGAEGAVNAADILKPYLARSNLKLIGSTTIEEYNKFIKKDKALERRFVVINIEEPDYLDTVKILTGIKDVYEKFHNLKITEENIEDIVTLANQYLPSKSNPDKAIDLLDSVCARVKLNSVVDFKIQDYKNKLQEVIKLKEQKVKEGLYKEALQAKQKELSLNKKIKSLTNNNVFKITKNDILLVLESKTNIPLVIDREQLILKTEKILKEKIYGQDKAIEEIISQLKKKFKQNKLTSFLLAGPTGVGKTQTVKLIAKYLTNNKLIRLDMSEYSSEISVNKLIGVAQGYVGYDDEPIFNQLQNNPFSVILLDEVEKASPKVINLFLQILDEGYITNSKGEIIDFKNTLIFMTSNIQNSLKVGFNNISNNELDNFMSKELIGRIDKIINYEPLKEATIRKYLENKHISNIEEVIANCEYQKYGLRNIKKLIGI